ncbi:MAG: cytochrome c-type biogenesis protein, partial [Pseudomonadota bacterium]|nr:cytochrome c-type biogenesis protein [Pseudomonadota bacterium]
MRKTILLVLLLSLPGAGFAGVEALQFDTPAHEAQYNKLIAELRCLVCQNQNLADSNAELAQDLRKKTYDMVVAEKSNREIVDYMVTRYGDFVLYRPPVKKTTYLLWGGPFLLLLGSLLFFFLFLRRRAANREDGFTEADHQRAQELLRDTGDT